MDGPFIEGISLIQQTEAMFSSRMTAIPGDCSNQQAFHDKRSFAAGILESWGLHLGNLLFSKDSQSTLNCILELINFRQKEMTFRTKIKQQIAQIHFEKEKYRSYLEQAKRTIEEKNRNLGKVENENLQMKNKIKKNDLIVKKERDEDKKLIVMLKSKNQQLLHEIKKKQQEVNRVKEQMKKSVGQKGVVIPKNNFEVMESLLNQGFSDKKQMNNSPTKREEEKFNFLIERNDAETKSLKRENTLLKQKIFDIKEEIVEFTKWIDRQLFGQEEDQETINRKYKSKFLINHNLLFKKQCIVNDLREVIQIAKDGIEQIQKQKSQQLRAPQQLQSGNKIKSSQFIKRGQDELQMFSQNKSFKKQLSKDDYAKTDRIMKNLDFQTVHKQTRQPRKTFLVENASKNFDNTPKSNKYANTMSKVRIQLANDLKKSISSSNNTTNTTSGRNPGTIQFYKNIISVNNRSKETIESMPVLTSQKLDFEEDLLSEVIQDNESSIISHIEPTQLIKSNAYDKWDILFKDDRD